MNQELKIQHELAEVVLIPSSRVNARRLKNMIRATLDQYQDQERIPASIIHAESSLRQGKNYNTPGYFLRLYRYRAELTQVALAKITGIHQHHLSEMEHNKRAIGKVTARKLAKKLKCDYHYFL